MKIVWEAEDVRGGRVVYLEEYMYMIVVRGYGDTTQYATMCMSNGVMYSGWMTAADCSDYLTRIGYKEAPCK